MQNDKKFDKRQYDIDYIKQNYKQVPLKLRVDTYNELKNILDNNGLKINTFIKAAIAEKIERDFNEIIDVR